MPPVALAAAAQILVAIVGQGDATASALAQAAEAVKQQPPDRWLLLAGALGVAVVLAVMVWIVKALISASKAREETAATAATEQARQAAQSLQHVIDRQFDQLIRGGDGAASLVSISTALADLSTELRRVSAEVKRLSDDRKRHDQQSEENAAAQKAVTESHQALAATVHRMEQTVDRLEQTVERMGQEVSELKDLPCRALPGSCNGDAPKPATGPQPREHGRFVRREGGKT